MRRCVWSRNLKNKETMARVGPQGHRKKYIIIIIIIVMKKSRIPSLKIERVMSTEYRKVSWTKETATSRGPTEHNGQLHSRYFHQILWGWQKGGQEVRQVLSDTEGKL